MVCLNFDPCNKKVSSLIRFVTQRCEPRRLIQIFSCTMNVIANVCNEINQSIHRSIKLESHVLLNRPNPPIQTQFHKLRAIWHNFSEFIRKTVKYILKSILVGKTTKKRLMMIAMAGFELPFKHCNFLVLSYICA